MLKAYFILFLKSIEERQIINFLRIEQSEGGKWSTAAGCLSEETLPALEDWCFASLSHIDMKIRVKGNGGFKVVSNRGTFTTDSKGPLLQWRVTQSQWFLVSEGDDRFEREMTRRQFREAKDAYRNKKRENRVEEVYSIYFLRLFWCGPFLKSLLNLLHIASGFGFLVWGM